MFSSGVYAFFSYALFVFLFLPIILGLISFFLKRKLWPGIIIGIVIFLMTAFITSSLDSRFSFSGGGYGIGFVLIFLFIYVAISLVELIISRNK